MLRRAAPVPFVHYDGARLPFADRSFDLVYAIDVLHHAASPRALVRELARCARKHLLLKDHTYRSIAGRWTLRLLDEVGNRRFGIVSPGLYQRGWEWLPWLEAEGFRQKALVHPLRCHEGP
jgi:SAM-dependent methyltransferase